MTARVLAQLIAEYDSACGMIARASNAQLHAAVEHACVLQEAIQMYKETM